jgi:MFS family permease
MRNGDALVPHGRAGILLVTISALVGLSPLFLHHRSGLSVLQPLVIVLFFVLGWFNALLDVPANSMLQKESEGGYRSRVYGVLTSMVAGVGVLPVIIGGFLADTLGVGKVIFGLGLCIVLYGMLRMSRSSRV